MHATGKFEVKMGRADTSEIGTQAGLGSMTIDKTWSGAITGSSKGEMLSTGVDKSMAYVALEKMSVTIDGRSGTFVLMHRATMLADDPKSGAMDITVMPHSGTGELQGIEGRLEIVMAGGEHAYNFEYSLPGG